MNIGFELDLFGHGSTPVYSQVSTNQEHKAAHEPTPM